MQIHPNCSEDEVLVAAKALKDGQLVVFPTETVYGLGADATNKTAVDRLYKVKERPKNHPLIIHISTVNLIKEWCNKIPEYATLLAETFWPGPMTLILPKKVDTPSFATGQQKTVGLRIPSHSVANLLLKKFESFGGIGIAAPSANIFSFVSPTSADHARNDIGFKLSSKDLILDGGRSSIGLESTIIDCTKNVPKILRPGAVTHNHIENLLQIKIRSKKSKSEIRHSGSFNTHYSPRAELVLNKSVKKGDGFLALRIHPTPTGAIRLASPNTLEEFANVLYHSLRQGDNLGLNRICAIIPDGDDLALAIQDRLIKASNK